MTLYREFDKNKKGRDFVCGDIHGCGVLLVQEMYKVSFDAQVDRLFCVGDLIDRGPNSLFALRFLHTDWFYSVRGNHEELLIENFMGDRGTHTVNGGQWYNLLSDEEREAIYRIVSKLPYAIRVGDVGIVHAEVPQGVESWKYLTENLTDPSLIANLVWGRSNIKQGYETHLPDIERVYCGHTILQEPVTLGDVRYIDTGAFLHHWGREGKLTLEQIYQEE